jgi:hypothetical protein
MSSTSSIGDAGIARAASRLRWGVFAVMGAMIVVYAAARFGLRLGPIHVEYRAHPGGPPGAPMIADATMLLLLLAMFQLTVMLRRIACGELFSVEVIGNFRRFASWLLVMALWELVAPIALAFAYAPSGPHKIEMAIDFRDVLTLGTTLLLFLIARLLEHARRLDEEVREFV